MKQRHLLWVCALAAALLILVAVLIRTATGPERQPVPAKGEALPSGLERAWSVEGPWTSAVYEPGSGVIYAVGLRGQCAELGRDGQIRRTFRLAEGEGTVVRLAAAPDAGGSVLLVFTGWLHKLSAYDTDGEQLWSCPEGNAIDDVWAHDLDGDGADEVIVGHNGFTGLHVLDGRGKLLWKTTSIGNVWHVCAGDVLGTGKPQVVTTSAAGQVHIFSAEGTPIKNLDPGLYASMVRVGPQPDGGGATIFVAGTRQRAPGGPEETALVALTGDGKRRWTLAPPAAGSASIRSAAVAPRKPWLAIATDGRNVHVVDTEEGRILASAEGQGIMPTVSWAEPAEDGEPLLLVGTGKGLSAFHIQK